MRIFTDIKYPLGISLVALMLHGCSESNPSSTPLSTYQFTVTNLTANQPISPVAIVLHAASYSGWNIGAAASTGLEKLAEGGDNSTFLSEAQTNASVSKTASGKGVLAPGASEVIAMTTSPSTGLHVSIAGMLVNTNDAFAGLDGLFLGNMVVGSKQKFMLQAYDAGTEAHTEAANTIPGPAGGGTGFDTMRDDKNNFVAIHSGVVTSSDGLATSALNETHRFDNPVMLVSIERIH